MAPDPSPTPQDSTSGEGKSYCKMSCNNVQGFLASQISVKISCLYRDYFNKVDYQKLCLKERSVSNCKNSFRMWSQV